MKIFKVLSVVIISVIALLAIIGLSMPDVAYTNSIEVNKTPVQALHVFSDENKMADWLIGFKSIEKISGKNNMPGTKYKLIITENGTDVEITEEVITYVENEEYTFKFYNEDISSTAAIKFKQSLNGTNITAENTLKGNGILMNLILPFFKGNIQSAGQSNYDLLKDLIDNN